MPKIILAINKTYTSLHWHEPQSVADERYRNCREQAKASMYRLHFAVRQTDT